MGHRPEHFNNPSFTKIFRNSIFWAAGQQESSRKMNRAHWFWTQFARNRSLSVARDSSALGGCALAPLLEHRRPSRKNPPSKSSRSIRPMLNPIMSIPPTTPSLSIERWRQKTTSHWIPPPTGPSSTKPILKPYRLILWLNNFPQTPEQRAAFEKYMEHGGGWIGFHVAGYNDKRHKWPWFVDFLGGAVFYTNNWPPLPAKLDRRRPHSSRDRGLCPQLTTPQQTSGICGSLVLASTRMSTFSSRSILRTIPIGNKDIITEGDLPVVWTNTKYRMIYINMGHGPWRKIYCDPTQNKLFENAILWLGNQKVAVLRLAIVEDHR